VGCWPVAALYRIRSSKPASRLYRDSSRSALRQATPRGPRSDSSQGIPGRAGRVSLCVAGIGSPKEAEPSWTCFRARTLPAMVLVSAANSAAGLQLPVTSRVRRTRGCRATASRYRVLAPMLWAHLVAYTGKSEIANALTVSRESTSSLNSSKWTSPLPIHAAGRVDQLRSPAYSCRGPPGFSPGSASAPIGAAVAPSGRHCPTSSSGRTPRSTS